MLLVPTKTLQPGMVLAQPVFHPARGELVLLNRNHELHGKLISRLLELNVSHVWVRCPDLKELDERINLKISSGHIDLYNVLE